jgi:hypothetical protein
LAILAIEFATNTSGVGNITINLSFHDCFNL